MSDDNGSIKLVVTENRGRALFSSRPLMAGEVILRDSPILVYLDAPIGAATSAAASYCSHCFRTIPPSSSTAVACPNCGNSSIFCSTQCQLTSLSTSHTPFVCQALSRLGAADFPLAGHPHDRHVLARFLIAAYNLAIVSASDFQTLLSLQGEPSVDETSMFLHSIISTVCTSPIFGQLGFSVELTAALLAKDKANAFGLMERFTQDKERSVRAYGIYPRASFFNHDCLPNACRFDYVDSVNDSRNTDIIIRVLHDIPTDREICLSYFPVNLKYPERQKTLREEYGFTCDCDRCKVEAKWSDHEEEEDEMEGDDNGMEEEDEEIEDVDDDGDDVGPMDNGVDEEDDDFPHQYFFLRYMCSRDGCGGTLAPLPPNNGQMPSIVECNVCGSLSNCEE